MYACVCVASEKVGYAGREEEGKGWFERPKDGGERTRNSRWKQRTAVGSSGWQVEGGKGVTAAASSSGSSSSSNSSSSSKRRRKRTSRGGSGERGGEGGSGERRSRRRRAGGRLRRGGAGEGE